jgi:hypothetical protein
MKKLVATFAKLALVAALLLFCRSAAAELGGCMACEEHNQAGTIAADRCVFAADGGTGYTGCLEESIGIFRYCTLTGDACYNVDVHGGGGGAGGAGGGSGSCSLGPGEACPAECSGCTRRPYLN